MDLGCLNNRNVKGCYFDTVWINNVEKGRIDEVYHLPKRPFNNILNNAKGRTCSYHIIASL